MACRSLWQAIIVDFCLRPVDCGMMHVEVFCMDYVLMGKRVRCIRRMRHITQKQLAQATGVSASLIGHVERGTRIPSVETVYRICKALGVSADFLMGI